MKHPEYTPMKFNISTDTLKICEGLADFYISVTYNDIKKVKHPRLFIRQHDNKGVLRLNFWDYFPVNIPKKFAGKLKSCSKADLIISSDDSSENRNEVVPVSHVLNFPDLYDLIKNQKKAEAENAPANPGGIRLNINMDDHDENKQIKQQDFFCRETLIEWGEQNNFLPMEIKVHEDFHLSALTDGKSKFYLYVLFEHSGTWLADEEEFQGKPPFYFSENNHVTSPLFAAKKAAAYLQSKTNLEIKPIVLFSDSAEIINEKDMQKIWALEPLQVCSCNKDYDSSLVRKLADHMNSMQEKDPVFTEEQVHLLCEAFKSIDPDELAIL